MWYYSYGYANYAYLCYAEDYLPLVYLRRTSYLNIAWWISRKEKHAYSCVIYILSCSEDGATALKILRYI